MTHVIGHGRTAREAYPVPSHASVSPASDVPLSRALYVDPNSAALGAPDGSDEHPFLTIQAAFNSKFQVGVDFECAFLVVACFNGTNTAGPLSIPANDGVNTLVSIVGLVGSNRSIETPINSTAVGALAIVDSVTIDPSAQNTAINGENVLIVGSISVNVALGTNVRISLADSETSNISAANVDVLLVATSVDGDLTAGTIEAYDSTTVGPPPGQTWTATTIRLDGATNYQLHTNSVTLVGQVIVMERQARATISVAVPALVADTLGYVNVSVAGTELDGITTGEPVLVNPTTDLAAAGAAQGFFIGARVSALNTVRLSFRGTLAGGAVNFTFSRV